MRPQINNFRSNNPWITLLSLTFFAVAFVAAITYASNRFSLLSLPSSPWPWPPSSSSSPPSLYSIPSFNHHGPPPPPVPQNPKTALYSMFHCDSSACKKQNKKMNKMVSKLMKELDAETLLRRDKEREKHLEKVEAKLARARVLIRDAGVNQSRSSHPLHYPDYVPQGDIYRNPNVFHRSYMLMEKLFKIYIYEEGELPLFHTGPSNNIYSVEGVFLNLMENNPNFRILDPNQAHVYFLPFSVVMILENLFDPIIRDKAVLERVIGDYVRTISSRYPYWNRSLGSDHFMLSCHDWGPRATWYVHNLYFTSMRLLCNANTSEFFNPRKDASIPEINLRPGETTTLTGGLPVSNRTILAFFAGQHHGKIRPVLFEHWKDKDEEIRVYDKVPANLSYHEMMRTSRFCICPSGFEVASPRIVEAIYTECVPVLISQHYVLPFSDVLDWDAFSVKVLVNEIPDLKKILLGISNDKYMKLQENVKKVQRHFVVNNPAKRYDVFHMILHSLWLRRLNLQIYG